MSQFTKEISDKLSAINARLDQIEAGLEAAKPAAFTPEPWHPFDATANMTAPVNAEVVRLGNEVLNGIRSDVYRSSQPSSIIPNSSATPSTPKQARGQGWAEPRPIQPPAGLNLIDNMCEEASRQEMLERAVRAAKLAKDLPPPKPKSAARNSPERILARMPLGRRKP